MIRALTIVGGAVGALGAVRWARRGGIRHVVVNGSSMRPTLAPGDRLVLVRVPGRPRVGQLALARDPRSPRRTLLKRVHDIDVRGVDLRGDGAASTDSRMFGRVPLEAVGGYVGWRYAPRVGRVGGRRPDPVVP